MCTVVYQLSVPPVTKGRTGASECAKARKSMAKLRWLVVLVPLVLHGVAGAKEDPLEVCAAVEGKRC